MKHRGIRRILELLTPAERRAASVLLCFMVIGMVLETLGIGLVIPAMMLLVQPDVAAAHPAMAPALRMIGRPSQRELVLWGLLLLVSLYLVKSAFLAGLAWRQTRFAFTVRARLSQQLFNTYIRQPYAFHLQRNSAQLIRNVVNEVDAFTQHGISPALVLAGESLVLAGIGVLLLVIEPQGALAVAAVLGSSAWLFHWATAPRITRWGESRILHEGLRMQHLQQGLGGAKEAKVLGRESGFLSRYHPHNIESANVGMRQSTIQQLPRLWLELLGVIGLAILILVALAEGGDLQRIVPIVGLFGAAAFRLVPSANRILGAIQQMRFGLPVVDTLSAELALPVDDTVGEGGRRQGRLQQGIELRQVTYTYPGGTAPVLRNVSLRIGKGESVGFLGASGSGKSTLIDLILGLLEPDTGVVCVDGVGIRADLRSWQNQIGYVPQTIYLTDDTLRRNVAFGLRENQINDLAVERAIRAAQLSDFVGELPLGLQTVVGERGVRLSGGQRQRIGIARALYHDPSVIVFDEGTSALDMQIEQEVMGAVNALKGKKTLLLVAHRTTTLSACDRLYAIRGGRIEERALPAQKHPVER